ncbi:MAG: hypothetical protein P8123_09105 [bacterium]
MKTQDTATTIFWDSIADNPGYFGRIRRFYDGWFEDEDVPLDAKDYDSAVAEIREYLSNPHAPVRDGGDYC